MFASDGDSERATSIEDYQYTCSEFIRDISKDYKDWVERYQLAPEEDAKRRRVIDYMVENTNKLIYQYGDSIKKIDIIMNDGINKMAESTAGYPFKIEITALDQSRYIMHDKKPIKLNLKSYPRNNRQVKMTNYDKDNIFLLNSSSPVDISYSDKSFDLSDYLDEYIIIKPKNIDFEDTISITVKIEELDNNVVMESRGFTTLLIVR
ncbi:hypothetical protein [Candidatus Nitrosocosmicus sp. SS]|jgi:hypothetical protein|uniref:hypothetical protein n=1 Tax=Candidatus Nitrosocosmicus agrestis TaxID=2563600 RepID=UPI00122DD424|nr:hypothetical protein [Candidatus Nitrosocosmicus sp. SS]KAA2280095.1 hypothetical protein F1Z66_12075 [Candidatus Nitrosocosmicus sp. SS]KAF0868282.1 hypothetical protein E5N71_10775 [Candidatus Nitrosocosmicus sp. SS]MDR4492556.1 hypothetical protein [Candidatus Nitrosocosmicus sp.]